MLKNGKKNKKKAEQQDVLRMMFMLHKEDGMNLLKKNC
jgi:hypothetical protein